MQESCSGTQPDALAKQRPLDLPYIILTPPPPPHNSAKMHTAADTTILHLYGSPPWGCLLCDAELVATGTRDVSQVEPVGQALREGGPFERGAGGGWKPGSESRAFFRWKLVPGMKRR